MFGVLKRSSTADPIPSSFGSVAMLALPDQVTLQMKEWGNPDKHGCDFLVGSRMSSVSDKFSMHGWTLPFSIELVRRQRKSHIACKVPPPRSCVSGRQSCLGTMVSAFTFARIFFPYCSRGKILGTRTRGSLQTSDWDRTSQLWISSSGSFS